VWTFRLDEHGSVVDASAERAIVRVAEAITYEEAQRRIDTATDSMLGLLRVVGTLRREIEADRGGVSIAVPSQEVVSSEHGFRLEFERTLPVEEWNAQISLMTGMAAAHAMGVAGFGIVRTLPEPTDDAIRQLRTVAGALGLEWPSELSYPRFVRTLDGTTSPQAAFLWQSVRLLRGAGYEIVDGVGEPPLHGAIAAPYSHVTAPLRRLVDRFAAEIAYAALNDEDPPGWAMERLHELPSVMARAGQLQGAVERAVVDYMEAMVLEPYQGQRFTGVVVDVRDDDVRIQLADRPIVVDVARNGVDLELSKTVELLLEDVDTKTRAVEFRLVR
jgi:exoribonuclease R